MSQKETQSSLLGNEFVQFLGGAVTKLTAPGGAFEGRPQAAAHETIAIVAEELLKLTYDKDGDTDFFRAKPLIRATMFLLERYMKDIEGADLDESLKTRTLNKCADTMKQLQIITNVEADED